MISLSILVKPAYETRGDQAGLVPADPVDECSEAIRFAREVARIDDVDKYLASDSAIRDKYVRESISLLRSANHTLEPYLDFLRQHGLPVGDASEYA
jgi:hypothetical protein